MKVLVLSPYPQEGASFRFRVLQYVPYLTSQGIQCTVTHFLSSSEFERVHLPRHYAIKGKALAAGTWRLLRALRRARDYDAILVHREVYPLATDVFERRLQRLGKPIILDVDDAIFLHQPHANRFLRRFRDPSKVGRLAAMSRLVMTSNDYLGDWFRQHATSVAVVPTAIDTDHFQPRVGHRPDRPVTIGWIGSPSTAPYLLQLLPVIQQLQARYTFNFTVVGAGPLFRSDGVAMTRVPWQLEREVAEFQSLDIGVYPLPDDAWAAGKGGFKTIQYMAVGVPVVASPVGVNRDIIRHGENGLLAATNDEWLRALSQLLEGAALRARIGSAGRRTVEARYSTTVQGPVIAQWLRHVVNNDVPPREASAAQPRVLRVPDASIAESAR